MLEKLRQIGFSSAHLDIALPDKERSRIEMVKSMLSPTRPAFVVITGGASPFKVKIMSDLASWALEHQKSVSLLYPPYKQIQPSGMLCLLGFIKEISDYDTKTTLRFGIYRSILVLKNIIVTEAPSVEDLRKAVGDDLYGFLLPYLIEINIGEQPNYPYLSI